MFFNCNKLLQIITINKKFKLKKINSKKFLKVFNA